VTGLNDQLVLANRNNNRRVWRVLWVKLNAFVMTTKTNALLWSLAAAGTVWAANALLAVRRRTNFRDKTVVVTGGSRGLGLVIARQLAAEGANIAICARDADELLAAKTDLRQYGTRIMAETCDVSNPTDVQHFIDLVRQNLGPVDVLINVAGIIIVGPLENTTERDFHKAMDVNFWGCYHTINAVLPDMRARRSGRIVNVASLGGKIAAPHLLPYVTSKFALVGYSEGLRHELTRHGIYVTTACPGLIRTGSPRQVLVRGQHEKEYAWFKTGDSLPLLTVSAETCANEILTACRLGKPEVIVSIPAKLATVLQGLLPGEMSEVMTLINSTLPSPATGPNETKLGKDSESGASETFLTTLTDRAAARNNQLAGG
jgi:NAD(P)-dependent dehydrogenase (short-subunit alcohol dehydrogenase family)